MKFARWVFWVAGGFGLAAIVPHVRGRHRLNPQGESSDLFLCAGRFELRRGFALRPDAIDRESSLRRDDGEDV